MHTRRFTIRAAAAATLATVALVLAAPAAPAFSGTNKPAPSPYTISIDSVTPSYASASATPIKMSGTLTNHSGTPATGLSVQVGTTRTAFVTPSAMSDYGNNTSWAENQVGDGYQVPGTVANGATVRWTATFTSASAGFSQFGVYGLEADALTPSQASPVATDRTYLPYWQGSGSADRLKIAWVWPLIDSPHQGACAPTLTDNSLEQSLSQTGRLGTLLRVGTAQQASTNKLTWAVDPALLSDAKVMTGSYSTGGTATCSGAASHRASSAATQWLNQLTSDTTTAGMFVTPYADVDVSALTHAGLENDLATAYLLGQKAADPIMQRSFDAIGWPADGIADQSVLTDIARAGNISTVLLDESEMPLTGNGLNAEDAVASMTTGTGGKLNVLLTNHALTSILSGSSGKTAASQFAVTQEFLAETAMIASEAPAIARSVVVAPPRNWDPSAGVASKLLQMTTGTTPWLQPVSLPQLASTPPPAGESRAQAPDHQISRNELSSAYIAKMKDARTSVNLLTSLLAHPGALVQQMQAAVAASQSSAWRGGSEAGGLQALQALQGFSRDRPERKIGIYKVQKETLAGPSGKLPVSVYNGLDEPIQVRARVTDSRGLTVIVPTAITVPARGTNTMELSVHSAQMGTTIVRLQLVTENGSPLPWATEKVSVVSTRYGRAVLVLIVAALGIVVLTSATRWIRKSMTNGGAVSTGGDDR